MGFGLLPDRAWIWLDFPDFKDGYIKEVYQCGMCFAGSGPRTGDSHGDWWWTEEQADYSNECKITLMLSDHVTRPSYTRHQLRRHNMVMTKLGNLPFVLSLKNYIIISLNKSKEIKYLACFINSFWPGDTTWCQLVTYLCVTIWCQTSQENSRVAFFQGVRGKMATVGEQMQVSSHTVDKVNRAKLTLENYYTNLVSQHTERENRSVLVVKCIAFCNLNKMAKFSLTTLSNAS